MSDLPKNSGNVHEDQQSAGLQHQIRPALSRGSPFEANIKNVNQNEVRQPVCNSDYQNGPVYSQQAAPLHNVSLDMPAQNTPSNEAVVDAVVLEKAEKKVEKIGKLKAFLPKLEVKTSGVLKKMAASIGRKAGRKTAKDLQAQDPNSVVTNNNLGDFLKTTPTDHHPDLDSGCIDPDLVEQYARIRGALGAYNDGPNSASHAMPASAISFESGYNTNSPASLPSAVGARYGQELAFSGFRDAESPDSPIPRALGYKTYIQVGPRAAPTPVAPAPQGAVAMPKPTRRNRASTTPVGFAAHMFAPGSAPVVGMGAGSVAGSASNVAGKPARFQLE